MTMKRVLNLVPLLGLLLAPLALTGCNGGDIDDPDGPNAVMEVSTTTIPPTTATENNGVCQATITNASSTLANKAINGPGEEEPFNDIVVQSVTIRYTWDNPAIVTAPRTFDLGATIPAGGSAAVTYPPIALGDLDFFTMLGHTATLDMTFKGTQVSGEVVYADGGGALSIGGSCLP